MEAVRKSNGDDREVYLLLLCNELIGRENQSEEGCWQKEHATLTCLLKISDRLVFPLFTSTPLRDAFLVQAPPASLVVWCAVLPLICRMYVMIILQKTY